MVFTSPDLSRLAVDHPMTRFLGIHPSQRTRRMRHPATGDAPS